MPLRAAPLFATLPLLLFAACASAPPPPDCPRCPEPAAQEDSPPPKAEAKPPIDAEALDPDRQRTIRLMGFSKDGSLVALAVGDDLMGSTYQIFDPAKQQVVKSYVYGAREADETWARVKRIHKLIELETASQRQPGSDLVLLGGDTDDWVVVYIMKDDRTVPYFRIPRLVDVEDNPADVVVKRLAWTPDGRYAIVVHTQALKRPRPFETDFIHIVELEPRRLPFD